MNSQKEGKAEKQSDHKLKNKLWFILVISLFASIGVSYWSYTSFSMLTASIDQLSLPNEKMDLLNDTFQEIIEAENHIHAFILTDDTLSRWFYRNKTASARHNINKLKKLNWEDHLQAERVDSLQVLFSTKLKYLRAFLKVKKEKQSSIFAHEALGHIARQMNDTALVEKQLMRSEIVKGELKPVKKQEIIITPDEYKGFGGFVRKLFGGDKTTVDTVNTIEDKLFFFYDVSVDTSIVKNYFRDSTLLKVKNILSRVRNKERKLQQQLTQKELSLLHQNQMFISNIRLLMNELKKQERSKNLHNQLAAKGVADYSMRVIFLIGFMALLVCGIFIILILKDVARSSYYRKQLVAEKTKAVKLAKVKEDFLSNMSHEIRTPLHSILGFSSLLDQTRLDARQKGYLEAITHSNAHLTALVDGILDQAKIEAGKLHLVTEPFSMIQVIKELKAVFSHSMHAKGLTFDVFILDNLKHYFLIGDIFRIKQILNNLLSNAIKFTEKGKIALRITGDRKQEVFMLKLQVADTGIGIAGHKISTIFDQFVQEDPGIAKQYGGTGLGLSIAKALTEAMGGEIMVESEPGKGAVFTIILSLPYIEAPKEQVHEKSSKKKLFVRANVMIVEDDGWNAVLLQEILNPRVECVRLFNNPEEALNFLMQEGQDVDIIFTDIKMPEMTGDQFLEKVRSIGIQVPVIALTAHMQSDKLKSLHKKGFSHVCSKPYRLADIEHLMKLYFNAYEGEINTHLDKLSDSRGVEGEEFALIDLSSIRAFSGEDEAVFERLVAELIKNNERQVQAFFEYSEQKDYKKIADLSHQMITTYDSINLHSISEKLAGIELYEKLNNAKSVLAGAKELYPELLTVLNALKKVRHQYRIA